MPTYFNEPMHMDTFGIRMYTEKAMYPVNTESVSVKNREPEWAENFNGVFVLSTSEGG